MKKRNDEWQTIRNSVTHYTEGVHTGNVDLLKKAFRPKAMMYGTSANAGTVVDIRGLYEYIAANEPPTKTGEPHECFIPAIQYAGNAAFVEVIEESLYGIDYTNLFTVIEN